MWYNPTWGEEMARAIRYDPDCRQAADGCRKWRREAELTQEQVAQLCGVHRSTVIRWEDPGCESSPGVVHLLRLCAGTGAIPEYLYRRLTRRGADD